MTELFREKIKYIGLTDPVEDLSFKQLIALLDKVKLENPCLNIVLNNTNYTFYNIGETYQLIATVTPPDTTDTIQWLSSDPAIASVDNQGIVTAVANGSCTITAICGDMQATCAISCAIIRPCTALRLNKSSVSFSAIGETYQLVANPTPSNTTDSIIWSTSNSNIATVTNSGKVTAGSTEGSCTITAKCGSKTATCSITMKIAKPCTSIVFSDSEDRFRIGWTYLLKVTTEPWNTTDPVIWTISDPSLITATPLGYNNTDLEIVVNSDYGSCVITAKCGSKSVSRTITCED